MLFPIIETAPVLSIGTWVFVSIVLWFVVAALITFGFYFIATRAVLFGRATFSLCIAIVLNQEHILVPGGGFLNFVAWAMIVFGCVYLLCLLPRVDIALHFSCTFVVSLVVAMAVCTLISGFLFKEFETTLAAELALKIACIGVSILMLALREKKLPSESSSNILVRNLDRLLASVLYGFCFIMLFNSISQNWELPHVLKDVPLVAGIVITFVADIFLADKFLFGYPDPNSDEVQ